MTEKFDDRLRAYLATAEAPFPDLAERSLERTLRPRGRGSLWTRLRLPARPLGYAVAALFLVAGGIATGANAYRLWVKSPASRSNPSSTSVDHGLAPRGAKLIWVVDPADWRRLQALDWSGKFVGTINLQSPMLDPRGVPLASFSQSPDGQRIFLVDRGPLVHSGFSITFLDTRGAVLGRWGSRDLSGRLVWAPDGSAVCGIRLGVFDTRPSPLSLPEHLTVISTSGAQHDVRAGLNIDLTSTLGDSVAACDPAHDRAVVVRKLVGTPTEMWLVQISNGRIVHHETYSSHPLRSIVLTADGTMVAENPAPSATPNLEPAPHTVIRRTADGSILATLPAGPAVVAFSGDGNLVLEKSPSISAVTPAPATPSGWQLDVVDWRTGHSHGTGFARNPLAALVEPGGRAFAEVFESPSACPSPAPQPIPACERALQYDLRVVAWLDTGMQVIDLPGRGAFVGY